MEVSQAGSANVSAPCAGNRAVSRYAWVREMAAIASGSEIALASLYTGTSSRVYGVAMRMTRNSADAAEVSLDVYLQVWRQAATYDPVKASVLTWLLAICHNRAIDRIRRRDRAEIHPDPHDLAGPEGIETDGPEVLALQVERDGTVRHALKRLVPVQRQLLTLAYYRGLTHEEIAHQTGLPFGTVKSHIRRGLQVLKVIIDGTPARTAAKSYAVKKVPAKTNGNAAKRGSALMASAC